MKQITLGQTGIVAPQNGFGALPIQRISTEEAGKLLRDGFAGGMRFFDTARAYSDSEEKVGLALHDVRDQIFLATKTMAKTPADFWKDLETSLALLQTDYVDIYQFHCADRVFAPCDGTGMYECMEEAKAQGKIRHIGITAHKIQVAFDAVESGLYATLQFPFSYLSSPQELELVQRCEEAGMGFIAMKSLAGGLITNSRAAMAFVDSHPNVMPIWGIQKEEELAEWLSYMEETPSLDDELQAYIAAEQEALKGSFCRGCGYCMPCPAGISIRDCARMSLMIRRAPSAGWLTPHWQEEMNKIKDCLQCGACKEKCPYELDTPALLQANLDDYQQVLCGQTTV